MWEDNNYCWVVLCKNNWFHLRDNLFYKHKIPLGETDVYTPPPDLKSSFRVRCDECHKEYLYKPSEVLRHDQELPMSFTPHPLFGLNFMERAAGMTIQNAIEQVRGMERRRSERLLLDVGLLITGQSVERKLFQEETFTISVSAHGALMVLSTKVALGQRLFVKNRRTQNEMESRVTRFGPPYGKQAQVGVDFARPAPMFWPVDPLPNSWKFLAKQSQTAS